MAVIKRFQVLVFLLAGFLRAQTNQGYYRFPAISGNTVVSTAEGDLWQDGTATRNSLFCGRQ